MADNVKFIFDTIADAMKSFANIPASEITPRSLYLRRREFLSATGAALAALATGGYAPEPGERVAVVISGANTTAVSFRP